MSLPANNSGTNKRQITDLVDQSIQINTQCFVVTADNRYILVSGFWDKSFRVYSSDTGTAHSLDIKGVIHSQCYILSSFTHLKSKYSFNYEGQKVMLYVCLQASSLRSCSVTGTWSHVWHAQSLTSGVTATLCRDPEMPRCCSGTGVGGTIS